MKNPLSWWAGAYLATIVAVNYGFTLVPPIDLGFGVFSPIALLVGVVFIIRDYAQRSVGQWMMLVYMGIGLCLTYLLVDPFLALASAAAFFISEMVDWLVFSYTGADFKRRVVVSNAVSLPVDSLVFLATAGFFTPATFIIMTLSKLVATILIWMYWKDERKVA